MAKVAISIAAQNTFTDPLNCPRDSVLVVLNPTGGTGAGTVTVQVQDYTNPEAPGVWEDWAKQIVGHLSSIFQYPIRGYGLDF